MTGNREIYTSSQKAILATAIGETILIAVLPIFVIDRISLKGLVIWLLMSIAVFGLMYAIEWSRKTIKSVEFSDGKIIILKSSTTYQDTFEPKIEIELKSIKKCVRKSRTSWNLEYGDNRRVNLNLYAFGSEATDKIISRINAK